MPTEHSRARARDARDRKACEAVGVDFVAPVRMPTGSSSLSMENLRKQREAKDRAACKEHGLEYVAPERMPTGSVSASAIRRARMRREAELQKEFDPAHTEQAGACCVVM